MVEGEFILLGIDRDANGIPWALLAADRDGELEYIGSAILNPPRQDRGKWSELTAAFAVAKSRCEGSGRARLSGFGLSCGCGSGT
jgi:hypothetical protein